MKTTFIVSSCSIIFFMHAVAQTPGTLISIKFHGNPGSSPSRYPRPNRCRFASLKMPSFGIYVFKSILCYVYGVRIRFRPAALFPYTMWGNIFQLFSCYQWMGNWGMFSSFLICLIWFLYLTSIFSTVPWVVQSCDQSILRLAGHMCFTWPFFETKDLKHHNALVRVGPQVQSMLGLEYARMYWRGSRGYTHHKSQLSTLISPIRPLCPVYVFSINSNFNIEPYFGLDIDFQLFIFKSCFFILCVYWTMRSDLQVS